MWDLTSLFLCCLLSCETGFPELLEQGVLQLDTSLSSMVLLQCSNIWKPAPGNFLLLFPFGDLFASVSVVRLRFSLLSLLQPLSVGWFWKEDLGGAFLSQEIRVLQTLWALPWGSCAHTALGISERILTFSCSAHTDPHNSQ